MIESKKFKEMETEFQELRVKIESNVMYNQEICYLFEQALQNIRQGHFEIAMFISCIIIESIASRKYYEEFKTFDSWLIENKKERLDIFSKEMKASKNEEVIIKWHTKYRETYGPRKNFVRIIIETYKNLNKVPGFMRFKTENRNGVKTSSYKTEGYKDANELNVEFEKVIKGIYDDYRSPFAHQGKFLSFDVRIHTKIGGISVPGCISLQDLAGITLNVMKMNLK